MNKAFIKEYFSIPNLMGYFRLVLAIVYIVLFYNSLNGGAYWPVILTIAVSGLTDFFDGKIARKFDMVTEWGKILDPIADKISIAAIILSLFWKYSFMLPMMILYLVKEGFMGIMGLIWVKKGKAVEGAKWYGKVCTFGTYVFMLFILLFHHTPEWIVNILILLNMILMLFTFMMYIIYYVRAFTSEGKGKKQ